MTLNLDDVQLPSISVVIPTLNSAKTLSSCLESVDNQNYPKEKVEIIIVDGGSVDETVEIAKSYAVNKIINNPLKTGEAGKAIGVKEAGEDIIALIDSDNILPEGDWLRKMIEPFRDTQIVGAEPLYYTYRREDGYITRYCALIGMNDPLCLYIGNYDRYCLLTGRWTDFGIKQEDRGDYLKIELNGNAIPTLGANGFLLRRSSLKTCYIGDYFFDIDIVYELTRKGHNKFAKVKVGIVHIYSENIRTFIKKQRRRIDDYFSYKSSEIRKYPWHTLTRSKLLKFILYTTSTIPLIMQVVKGLWKKKDKAWFFHIFACWITLIVYGLITLRNHPLIFGITKQKESKKAA